LPLRQFVASSLLPNILPLETLMKCNLVQAGQTIDSKVSFGKGGLLSSSHVWTFKPVAGHRNVAFAISHHRASHK
jgi:hypothetical protein